MIDASGTWTQSEPFGGDGLVAAGELEHAGRIAYGMPDVLGRDRAAYAGRHTVVVGAGYSAANVLLDLVRLAADAPETSITWVVRGTNLVRVYGGGLADQLPARGALGWRLKEWSTGAPSISSWASRQRRSRRSTAGSGSSATRPTAPPARSGRSDRSGHRSAPRPRHDAGAAPRAGSLAGKREGLGALIDPNLHSCGSVAPARLSRARPPRARLLHDRG